MSPDVAVGGFDVSGERVLSIRVMTEFDCGARGGGWRAREVVGEVGRSLHQLVGAAGGEFLQAKLSQHRQTAAIGAVAGEGEDGDVAGGASQVVVMPL